MNKITTLAALLFLATTVHGGELKIVETDDRIIAEYTGVPPDEGGDGEKPSNSGSNAEVTRVKNLNAQIERLKMEIAELEKISGHETDDEVAAKHLLADEKRRQIEIYAEEIR
jgi:hypothetical protein